MTTRLTPYFDSLMRDGYIYQWHDFREGHFANMAGEKELPASLVSHGISRRHYTNNNAADYWTTKANEKALSEFTLLVRHSQSTTASCRTVYSSKISAGNRQIIFYTPQTGAGNTVRLTVIDDTGTSRNYTSGALSGLYNQKNTWAVTWKADTIGGLNIYQNGSSVYSTTTAGHSPVTFPAGDWRQYIQGGASGLLNVEYVLHISKELTSAQIATLVNEIENEMSFVHKPLTINNFYAAGQAAYIAKFGIIAGEITMAAKTSLGQLNALQLVSGTAKMSVEWYNGELAKVITRVSNCVVRLPNPTTDGTTFYFKKYTGGAWTNATSASTDISLGAGEKILWATRSGRDSLYKA